ncbi:unnamed protein product, partial [Closterium sp. NIES-54]
DESVVASGWAFEGPQELQMKEELERLKAQYLQYLFPFHPTAHHLPNPPPPVQKDNMCVDDQTASAVLTEVNVQKFSALLILYLVVSLLCCITYVGILIYRGYRYHRYDLVTTGTTWLPPVRPGYHRYDLVTTGTTWLPPVRPGYHRYDLVTAPLPLEQPVKAVWRG